MYVHLNPVCTAAFALGKRAKQMEALGVGVASPEEVSLRLKVLREYRWSSYRCFGGYAKGPDWLQSGVLLARAHRDPKQTRAAYRRDIRNRLAHGVDPSKAERLHDALAIGAERFVRAIKKQSGGGGRETSGKRQLRRQCSIDEILHTVEQVCGETRQTWLTHRGGDNKSLAMLAARRYGGLTLRETGEALGGVDYAAVSIAIKRLERKAATERNLRKQIELIRKMLNVET